MSSERYCGYCDKFRPGDQFSSLRPVPICIKCKADREKRYPVHVRDEFGRHVTRRHAIVQGRITSRLNADKKKKKL